MSSENDPNSNWDLAILTFVILILLFFWIYRFLFINQKPIELTFTTDETIQ